MRTPSLQVWARGIFGGGTEFQSQGALSSYLKEHPKADASKHSVAAPAAAAPAASGPHHEATAKASKASDKAAKVGTSEAHMSAAREHAAAYRAHEAAGEKKTAAEHKAKALEHSAESMKAPSAKEVKAKKEGAAAASAAEKANAPRVEAAKAHATTAVSASDKAAASPTPDTHAAAAHAHGEAAKHATTPEAAKHHEAKAVEHKAASAAAARTAPPHAFEHAEGVGSHTAHKPVSDALVASRQAANAASKEAHMHTAGQSYGATATNGPATPEERAKHAKAAEAFKAHREALMAAPLANVKASRIERQHEINTRKEEIAGLSSSIAAHEHAATHGPARRPLPEHKPATPAPTRR